MYSVNESRAIRDNFGKFWRIKSGSGNKFPHELKGITVTNVSTFSTRVRVCLLKEVCKKHQVANPELSCFITNYLARHELKIRPRRGPMVTLSYSEVVTQMSQHLSRDFLVDLFKFSKINLPEKELVERFLVLTPDVQLTSASQSELSLISMDEQPVLNANTSSPLPSSQNLPGLSRGTSTSTMADEFSLFRRKRMPCFPSYTPYERPT
jgi:hypothetical protein